MPSITGIELSPDSCVLVRAQPARGATEIAALHLFDRLQWPAHDVAISEALGTVRRRKAFPRRARLVVWGLPEDLDAGNPIVNAFVKPVVAAGFRVEAVMSPPQALAALARLRSRPSGTASLWLALNVHGAAVAAVRDGELLYSRTFDWSYRPNAAGTKAELLQRYSLVAHLAPEVRRALSVVRANHGAAVDGIVTCGDLPELRSLTMPLIEELDLEVETLDSTEGLIFAPGARMGRFAESAPTLRLACAAATAPLPRHNTLGRSLKIAASVALLAAGAWIGSRYWQRSPEPDLTRSPAPAGTTGTRAPAQSTPPAEPLNAPSATRMSPGSRSSLGSPATPAAAGVPDTVSGRSVPAAPRVASPEPPQQTAGTPATGSHVPSQAASEDPVSVPQAPKPSSSFPSATQPSFAIQLPERDRTGGEDQTRPPARQSPARRPSRAAETPAREAPPPDPEAANPARATDRGLAPLKSPVPVIDSILISHDRRLAIIGGSIVKVGDSVGPRVVVAIDRESVVFREPSGFELRVNLRPGPVLH